jgi:hypothetical protein
MLPRQQKSTEICSLAAGRWSSVIFESEDVTAAGSLERRSSRDSGFFGGGEVSVGVEVDMKVGVWRSPQVHGAGRDCGAGPRDGIEMRSPAVGPIPDRSDSCEHSLDSTIFSIQCIHPIAQDLGGLEKWLRPRGLDTAFFCHKR